MPDLLDGDSAEIQGSARSPYILKNVGGVYSCSCPAWRNQSLPIERRSCKHLRRYRGQQAEQQRLGPTLPASDATTTKDPALLLAEAWDGEQAVDGWLMSEKLDGVRGLWDGTRFLSRQGHLYHAPAWFTVGLPAMPLDGELWLKRGAFQRTVSIVRRHDATELWRELRFLIFDAPALDAPFEQRLKQVGEVLAQAKPAYASLLPHEPCRHKRHLLRQLDTVIAQGGEGLMLREPGSRYIAGRSSTLLKVKRFHDAEARVIGHQPGAGRHKGRLGAVLVELPNGVQFAVGSGFTDREREQPPAIGSTITFRYQELTERGVPRFPTFVRVRTDIAAAT
ncbi:MAG: DNA ligase [Planctomycetaceae bacterium]|nr:DNA ligase [Planctomycetaceae bacterium]